MKKLSLLIYPLSLLLTSLSCKNDNLLYTSFQEIKDIVRIEYKKSQENEVIEDYLNKLRETYIVEISDDF